MNSIPVVRFSATIIGVAFLLAPLCRAEPAPSVIIAPKVIAVDDADKLLKSDPKVVVIDVRTPDEFKAGHIPGALNIDFLGDDFATRVSNLDTKKTYLVHCASGHRSAQACKIFEKDKFPTVYHLNAGFTAWEKAGKPVER